MTTGRNVRGCSRMRPRGGLQVQQSREPSNTSSMQTRYRISLFLVAIFLASGISFLCGQKHPLFRHTGHPNVKVDTLFIHDTLTCYEPIFKEKRVIEKQLVQVTDTLIVHDTLYVYLNREQVVWQDSLSVVYASGILPQVDSVRHFTSNQIITIEKAIPITKKTHWGLGIQAGYGLGYADKRVYGVPYIGVGISYNILSW